MPAQFYESLLSAPALGAGAAYNTSVTLTDVSPTPQLVLPANYLFTGSALKITATGTFSNTVTPTLLLGFYFGGVAGVALTTSGAVTTTTGATSWPWRIEATAVVRSIGASGTIMTAGVLYLATSLTTFAVIPISATAQAVATVNTSAAAAITLGAQWGTNSASNTLTCNQMLVESLA